MRSVLMIVVLAVAGCDNTPPNGSTLTKTASAQVRETAAEANQRAEAARAEAKQKAEAERVAREAIAAQARKDAIEAMQRAEAERVAQERASIVSDPNSALEASDFSVYDKGIINDYRQLTRMTVVNKSRYALRKITGTVDWFGDDGSPIGSTAVTLAGSLPAGDTKQFSTDARTMASTTLQGKSARYRLRFTSAEFVE